MGHIQTHFVDDFCTFDLLKWEFHVYSVVQKRESKIGKVSESDVEIVVHCLVTRLRESASGKI